MDVVGYGDGFDSPHIQSLLSLGLVPLKQMIDADSHEARQRLVQNARPGPIWEFLYEALKRANQSDEEVSLSDYNRVDDAKLAHYHTPFVQDPNTGPADAWRWANQDETRKNFVYSDSQIALRARGYFMWDRAQLEEWQVFEEAWGAPDYPFHGNEQTSRRAEMQM